MPLLPWGKRIRSALDAVVLWGKRVRCVPQDAHASRDVGGARAGCACAMGEMLQARSERAFASGGAPGARVPVLSASKSTARHLKPTCYAHRLWIQSRLISHAHPCHLKDMGEAAKRLATYADLQAVPPHLVAEIVNGELYTQARPAAPHANACTELAAWARWQFKRGHGGRAGWWILTEPELHFATDVCVPDIAGWRKERLPSMPRDAYFTLAPDWICEVLSASTESFDRKQKMTVYAREGIRHAWLLNPLERYLEAFELSGGRWMRAGIYANEDCARIAPFEDVELDLAELWVV